MRCLGTQPGPRMPDRGQVPTAWWWESSSDGRRWWWALMRRSTSGSSLGSSWSSFGVLFGGMTPWESLRHLWRCWRTRAWEERSCGVRLVEKVVAWRFRSSTSLWMVGWKEEIGFGKVGACSWSWERAMEMGTGISCFHALVVTWRAFVVLWSSTLRPWLCRGHFWEWWRDRIVMGIGDSSSSRSPKPLPIGQNIRRGWLSSLGLLHWG